MPEEERDEGYFGDELPFYDNRASENTLKTYEARAAEYVAATPVELSGSLRQWLNGLAELLPAGARVLELGSGPGLDAAYLESLGCQVDRTDGAMAFVQRLRDSGHDARQLDVVTGEFGSNYQLVYANAVLLHLPPVELALVLAKSLAALADDGLLAFTVKRGRGSEWSLAKLGAPRFFQYWQPDFLVRLVERTGFSVEHLEQILEPARHTTWLHIVARKPE